eukprot:XP_011449309.1 PREDICTED: deoxynucleoside triphosphate triphosphohydrolase SAMHD1 [Crassostrea gigas]
MATKGNDVNVNDEVTSATTGPSEEDKQQAEVPQSQNTSRDAPEKIFNDPVHGHIKIPPLCVKIIDTPQFQRLRSIKQLGGTYFVYPGAAHNRFEHSLGVCYLAGQLASALKVRQPHLGISKEDILCVQIAGLCHDLGHGPFSRMFEDKFLPMVNRENDQNVTPEILAVRMFEHLVNKNKMKEEFDKYNLTVTDIDFIKEQIAGSPKTEEGEWSYKGRPKKKDFLYEEWPYKGRPKKKDFLYEIVANKRNGVDVDKWDYLARDCHMLGIKSNFDHTRCMEYAKVLTVKVKEDKEQQQLCFRKKEARNLYDMFYNWDTLKRRAYQHDVGEIIETMIADAMWEANKIIKITGTDGKRFEISRTVTHMEAYEKLNDSIIDIILLSEKEGLEKSKEILERVQKRELFTCVGEINDPKVINMTWEDYIKQAEKDYHGILVKKDSSWKLEDFFIHVIIADN